MKEKWVKTEIREEMTNFIGLNEKWKHNIYHLLGNKDDRAKGKVQNTKYQHKKEGEILYE